MQLNKTIERQKKIAFVRLNSEKDHKIILALEKSVQICQLVFSNFTLNILQLVLLKSLKFAKVDNISEVVKNVDK